jgi:tetratricopeptide (TPR) repeat protein
MLHETETRSGRMHPDLIGILEQMAGAYIQHGAYLAATAPLERALRIAQTAHGQNSTEAAVLLGSVAQLRLRQGDYPRAEEAARSAVAIAKSLHGEDNVGYALLVNGLAEILVATGKLEGVDEILEQALDTINRRAGPASYPTTLILEALSRLYFRAGRVYRAENALMYSLTVRSESGDPLLTGKPRYDPDPMLMGPLQSILGALYTSVGYPDRARPLLHEALSGYEKKLDELHPLLEEVLVHLAALYGSIGNLPEARKYRERAEHIHAANLGYAYSGPHALPSAMAVLHVPKIDGPFSTAKVGDWVVYHSGDSPFEKYEIVKANPRAVVVLRQLWDSKDGKFSGGTAQTVERWIDLKEYFGLGHGEFQRETVTFRSEGVSCLTFTTKSADGTANRYYFAPQVIPVGGLLRLDTNDQPFLLVATFGRAR